MADKTKFSDEWKVRDHGPIEALAENLWWVSGSIPGMSLRRNMVVAKRTDGTLVIHNAIALREEQQRELEALGEPAFLVVPNGWHRLDAPAYKKRYPKLRVIAPSGSRKKVEAALPVDATYEEFPPDPAIRFETLHGMNEIEGAMIVTSRDGTTVVLTDAVFNLDRKLDFTGRVITKLLGSAPGPRVSRLFKFLAIKDRPAFHADLERYAELGDLQRLIVAHENCAHGPAARDALLAAATFVR